jgi:transcription initiation factor IIE alpha subunit
MRAIGSDQWMTFGEQVVFEFLKENKGTEFTAEEIEQRTGVHASLIPDIMDNLRWKNFEVCTEKHRGVHYYPNNTWKSYLIGGSIFAAMFLFILYSFIQMIQ